MFHNAAPLGHKHPLSHSNKGGRHKMHQSARYGGSNKHPEGIDGGPMQHGGTQPHPDMDGVDAVGGLGGPQGEPISGGAGGDGLTPGQPQIPGGGMSLGLGGE